VESEHYLDAIRRDGGTTIELIDRGPSEPIESCPGWTAADLGFHLVETFEGTCTDFGSAEGMSPAAALERALEVLPANALEEAQAVAQECAIHRWDAATAFGQPYEVEPELACDSIPSFFEDAWPMLLDHLDRPAGTGQTLHLHRTDGEGEWLVTLDHRPVVTVEHRKADVAVRGSASDLLLWLWGRIDPPEIHGDRTVLESIATQGSPHLSPGF
jgi:hypothetical protein